MYRFVVIDFPFIINGSLYDFYKLFMSPIFMKFVGGYPSTKRMLRKI